MLIKKIGKIIAITIISISANSCSTINIAEKEACSLGVREDIPHAVVKFLDDNGWDMSAYKLIPTDEEINYNKNVRYYIVEENIDRLWSEYTTGDARTSWIGDVIDFGLLYSEDHDSIFTLNEKIDLPYAEGQIFFLNLNFHNIHNLCVSFKITKIEVEDKIIKFSYLEKNFVNGYQSIKFIPLLDENGNDICIIEHNSFFKSDNFILDKFFYASFHNDAIDDMHNQILKKIEASYSIISKDECLDCVFQGGNGI